MTADHQASSPKPLQGLRVLLVDDDDIARTMARELLEDRGASVSVAANGAEAVAACLVPGAVADIVLMDNEMPLLGGIPATAAIRSRRSALELPIIGLSTRFAPADREKGLAAGMNDYLCKPFDIDLVVSTLLRHRPEA